MEKSNHPKGQTPLVRLLNSPYVGLASLLIGILGVILTVFIYFAAQERRSLSVVLEPLRSLVASSPELEVGGLAVLGPDGERVESDVYAVRAYVWNSGSAPLEDEDILEPIEVCVERRGDTRLLRVGILRSVRELSEVVVEQAQRLSSLDCATVSFRILEPGDGMTLLVLYSGEAETQIVFAGTLKGVVAFRDGEQIAAAGFWLTYAIKCLMVLLGIALLVIPKTRKVLKELLPIFWTLAIPITKIMNWRHRRKYGYEASGWMAFVWMYLLVFIAIIVTIAIVLSLPFVNRSSIDAINIITEIPMPLRI